MLNLESNNLKFTFNGVEKCLRFPTVREWDSYAKKAKDGVSVSEVVDFLIGLGLDKKTADILEPGHLEQILEAISKPKKK
jgi:hypothetical protein